MTVNDLLRRVMMKIVCAGLCCTAVAALLSTVALAQSTEMEATLFVQDPHLPNAKDGIDLIWVPPPIERLCLGRTAQQCASIDYCIRTTTKNVAMCRNLGIPLSRLPSYPQGMSPRRQLSIRFFKIAPATSPVKNIAMLQDFFRNAPRPSLEHLSMSARVKARVRLTRTPEDDDFDVLEIRAVAPF